MIILDTNVISETLRPRPDAAAIRWLDEQDPGSLHLCAPVLAELNYGVARLGPSARKRELERLISELALELFPGRTLSFDSAAASEYGDIVAAREASGRPITVMDALIAAIARAYGAALATRNVRDFELTGIELINPFSETSSP